MFFNQDFRENNKRLKSTHFFLLSSSRYHGRQVGNALPTIYCLTVHPVASLSSFIHADRTCEVRLVIKPHLSHVRFVNRKKRSTARQWQFFALKKITTTNPYFLFFPSLIFSIHSFVSSQSHIRCTVKKISTITLSTSVMVTHTRTRGIFPRHMPLQKQPTHCTRLRHHFRPAEMCTAHAFAW